MKNNSTQAEEVLYLTSAQQKMDKYFHAPDGTELETVQKVRKAGANRACQQRVDSLGDFPHLCFAAFRKTLWTTSLKTTSSGDASSSS